MAGNRISCIMAIIRNIGHLRICVKVCGPLLLLLVLACKTTNYCEPGSEEIPPHLVGAWKHVSELGQLDVLVYPDGQIIVYHDQLRLPGNYRQNVICFPVLDGDWIEWFLFVPKSSDGSEWMIIFDQKFVIPDWREPDRSLVLHKESSTVASNPGDTILAR